MKALGLLSLLFGFTALSGTGSEAQAAARPTFRPPLRPSVAVPPSKGRAQNGWGGNRRRFASAYFYDASWLGYSAYPQADAVAPDAVPWPVVNYVYVNAPAVAAPVQESRGPRFIEVDRGAYPRPGPGGPLVIYGDAPEPGN
jgi:hypothetical protein